MKRPTFSAPHFCDLIGRLDGENGHPWLIIGKGPSLALWEPRFLEVFNCIAVNHAVLHVNAPIVHVFDYENWTDIDLGGLGVRYVVMPAVPQWRRRYQNRYDYEAGCLVPQPATIEDYLFHDYRLRKVRKDGQLHIYDVDEHGALYFPGKEPLEFCGASGVPILHALLLSGHRRIFTIGVDGGGNYAPDAFERECVDTAHPYDIQMAQMRELAERYGAQIIQITNERREP